MNEDIESLAAEVHKVYCDQRIKNGQEPYWTNGDYSKLDEPTKEYDRAMARWYLNKLGEYVHELAEKDNKIKRMVEAIDYLLRKYDEGLLTFQTDGAFETLRATTREDKRAGGK